MKNEKRRSLHHLGPRILLWLASLLAFNSPALVFTIDPAQSSISLTGSVVGFPILEQATGSLVTKFSGTINADVTATIILFTGASGIVAQDSGNWNPKTGGTAGSASANYGGKASAGFATALAAIRNAQFDVTSLPLALTGSSFPSTALLFRFLTNSAGAIDYSVSGFFPKKGGIPLAGLATNRVTTQATLITSGNIQTLTIPIVADFFFDLLSTADTALTISGQIVATRVIGAATGTFASWAGTQFPGVSDQTIVGPAADPDHDGIPNFVEYAFGLNPTVTNPAFAPLQGTPDPNHPGQGIFEFIRPKGLGGVSYLLQASTNLTSWSVIAVMPTITDLGGGLEKVSIADPQPMGVNSIHFALLSVTAN